VLNKIKSSVFSVCSVFAAHAESRYKKPVLSHSISGSGYIEYLLATTISKYSLFLGVMMGNVR